MRPGSRQEPWKALSLLVTFVMGGFFMPVVHKVDHSAEWSRQQAAAHSHGDIDARSVLTVCADVETELPDCRLCHRDWLDRHNPERLPLFFDRSDTFPLLPAGYVPLAPTRATFIRGPPALA